MYVRANPPQRERNLVRSLYLDAEGGGCHQNLIPIRNARGSSEPGWKLTPALTTLIDSPQFC
ncbi:hypothetical protein GCM10009648_07460 [Tsukamurella spumae]